MFNAATLSLFAQLLDQLQLPAKNPDFEALAAQIVCAKRELAEAIADANDAPSA